MPVDPNVIKGQIDANLADNNRREGKVSVVRTVLKLLVDWVTGAINGNVGAWNKVGTVLPAASNADDVYRTGKVGIGTATPSQKLEVVGSVAYSSYLVYRNGTVDAGYIGNGQAGGGTSSDMVIRAETGSLVFARANAVLIAIMTQAGRFGIGLNTPAEALHVSGNIQADGFIRAGSGNMAFKITGVKTGSGLTLKTTRYLELTLSDGTIVKVAEVN